MARAFKDLIINEADHTPRVSLINRDGTVALQDVSVQLASPIAQEGDRWGAKEANLLLKMGDDGVAYPDVAGYPRTHEVQALVDSGVAKCAPTSHAHAASAITAGTLQAGVRAAGGSDLATARLRNIYYSSSAPASLENGVLCFVYE